MWHSMIRYLITKRESKCYWFSSRLGDPRYHQAFCRRGRLAVRNWGQGIRDAAVKLHDVVKVRQCGGSAA